MQAESQNACGRLEMTLRTDDQKSTGYEGLKVGDVVEGRVVRVKDFGVFVQLDGKPVTGLVHKSEISDQFVKNMSGLFTRLQCKLHSVSKDLGSAGLGVTKGDVTYDEACTGRSLHDAFVRKQAL